MRSLKWSTSHAVFVSEIDDEHKEIFEEVSNLQLALSGPDQADLGRLTQRLVGRIEDHFAHEERLMRAARYSSLRWHKEKHDGALKRVGKFVQQIDDGDAAAAPALIKYLSAWLGNHTRLADTMLGAFLRNHQRGLFKIRFEAGTRPKDSCEWTGTDGERFDPAASSSGY